MSKNQGVKVSIKAEEIEEFLITAISNAVEVNVTTIIAADLDRAVEKSAAPYFSTYINLVEGTIDREIDLKLIDNPAYRELQRWHVEQVKQRQATLIKHLASLEEMRRLVNGYKI